MEDKTQNPKRGSLFPYAVLGCISLLILIQVFQRNDDDEGASGDPLDSSVSAASRDAGETTARRPVRTDAVVEQIREQLNRKTAEYAELKDKNVELERRLLELQGSKKSGGNNEDDLSQMMERIDQLSSTADSEMKAFQEEVERQAAAFVEKQLKAEQEKSQAQITALESKQRDELARSRESLEQEIEAILDESSTFQYATARAMIRVGAAAVPTLTNGLRDNSSSVRAWSAYVLGEIGADAASALPELRDAQSDSDETVRAAAGRAITLIGEGTNR